MSLVAMRSVKSIETAAELAAESAGKVMPAALRETFGPIFAKSGVDSVSRAARLETNAAATELLAPLTISEAASQQALSLSRRQLEIMQGNKALLSHVSSFMPQVQQGRLDWILGGSAAVNALASAGRVSILDSSRLPAIKVAGSIELPAGALSSYSAFLRPVGDLDAFVVNGGKNKFLNSTFLSGLEPKLPEAAYPALKAVGEARSSRLVQAVKMEFEQPEIAAIAYGERALYLAGPGQLMSNKFRQVLMSYAPMDAAKLTGDFVHLHSAASAIYSEQAMLGFGRKALDKNGLLYGLEVSVPWEKTAANEKFVSYLRRVLESEERNGAFLKGLQIDSGNLIRAMRLFEKQPLSESKAALAAFINRHAERVGRLELRGSAEHALYLKQGGVGKAGNTFMSMLEALPAASGNKGAASLSRRLENLESELLRDNNLPALAKKLQKQYAGQS